MKFKLLISAIEKGEDFLLERLYKYASEGEYTQYSSTKEEDWRLALRKPSEALVKYLKSNEGPDPIHVDEKFKKKPIALFGILEAKRHRERGVEFEMFFGLTKLIRLSFIDLVYEMNSSAAELKLALVKINRFFDKFELGFASEWINYDERDVISDLQKSNRELTNRKNRYLTLFKSLADPAFVVDKHLHILEINDAFITQLGAIDSEFIGKEWSQCFNNEFVDAIPLREIVIQSSTFEGIECKLLMRNEEKIVICSGSFLNDRSGKNAGGICIIKDITESILVQESLAESENNYRTMIEGSSDMIWTLDMEGRFVFINENVRKVTGLNLEEWIGKSFVPLIFKEELQMLNDIFQKCMEGESSSYKMHFRKEDGEVLIFSVKTSPIKKGETVSGIVSFGQDITLTLQTQDRLESYKKLFEESLNEIYFFDAGSYKFLDVNRVALQNLGYTNEEIKERTPVDIKPEVSKKEFNKMVRDLKNHQKDKLIFNTIHKRKNGTTYPVEVHLQYIEHEDYPICMAMILDISDRMAAEYKLKMNHDQLEETVKQRTAEIENQARKLEESQIALTFLLEDMNLARKKSEETTIKLINANKELESFSYSVSHDLRAPLRAIVGFSAKFNKQYNPVIDEEGKRLLNVISRSALKMGRLIDDLLTFSRMSRTEIRKLNVNMKSLAEEAWLEVGEQIGGRSIQIEMKALPDARGDRNMLKQVYINLLSNAIKFSKSNASNPIEVGSDSKDGTCIYYVKDHGVGFDMKYAEKLFQVFQRLHSEKEFEGTGVGLALVQRILYKHEGKIWAESEVGKGATF